jgi:hypothetical protein
MFWLKGCPRCKGDLYEDTDKYGRYVNCLQCGYHCIQTQGYSSLLAPDQETGTSSCAHLREAFAMKLPHDLSVSCHKKLSFNIRAR